MLTALQSNSERSLELGHGAGEHHGAARRVLLYDTQAVTGRECLDCGDIRGIRSVLAREFIPRQVPGRALSAGEPTYPVVQVLTRTPTEQDTHLQSLRRIGGSCRA
jgi:hypothetical protein